ncbi:centromere protein U [Xyrichtys novacula]|nr:centromere protein U [Xyrichtys novacula]
MESFNLSAIEKDSFMEGLQKTYDNPLHSTAIEENLNIPKGQRDKGKSSKTGAAAKRKNTEQDAENGKEEEKKRRKKSSGGNAVGRPEKEAKRKKGKGAPEGQRDDSDTGKTKPNTRGVLQELTPTASSVRRLVEEKPSKRRSATPTSAARKVNKRQMKKDKKKESTSGSGSSHDPVAQNQSPKKAKQYSFGGTRKSSSEDVSFEESSSGSANEESEEAKADKKRSKKQQRQRGTELEVVLDTFSDFCEEYRESVESTAARQSIDAFSTNVKQQLIERITSYKEFRAVKRENDKVASLIQKKRQTLLDAKYELMRAERQKSLLEKEKCELELRLADLRKGQAFLHDLRELNKLYLDFRREHPKAKETYGKSSLPAVQLENQDDRSSRA